MSYRTLSSFSCLAVLPFVVLAVSSGCGLTAEPEFQPSTHSNVQATPQVELASTGTTSDRQIVDLVSNANLVSTEPPNPVGDESGPSDEESTPADESNSTDESTDQTGDEQPPEQPALPDETAFLGTSDMRAMWIWDETPGARELIENTGGARDNLLAFAAAPHGRTDRALNRFYFEAREHDPVDVFKTIRPVTWDPLTDAQAAPDLRTFLSEAHAAGIAVEYLDGQAIWLASDANAAVPKQICKDVVAFNKAAPSRAERFDGVHFDIEPHTVQSGPYAWVWWDNRLPNGYNADWTARWKDILNDCRATFDAYEQETGHYLTLAGDVGADYGYYNKPILNFLNGASSPVDYIGIMNYFDNRANTNGNPSFFYGMHDGNAVTGGVVENLSFWDSVPVVFGVETGPTQIAPDAASFYQEGYKRMHSVTEKVHVDYGGTNALGVAIHHYGPQGYRAMAP